jgi:AraC-like DNA-binding protein
LNRGLPIDALFSHTSLTRRELEAGSDITVEDFVSLLENAKQVSGDETLGLMIGRHADVSALGSVGMAAAAAPNLRAGLQTMESYALLHASYVTIELASNLQGLSLKITYLATLGEVERFHAETWVMWVQHFVERVTGLPLQDAHYQMRFEKPAYTEAYARDLHSPVSFGHPYTSVEIPKHWLDTLSPFFDARAWRQSQVQLAHSVRERSSEAGDTYSQHVTALLRSFEPPLPELSEIVARLHVSERTLNRRLRGEGSSFREIKSALLQNWARQYLAETGHTVEAIAALLGYQDTANFRRAFRLWEGCSPGEFRRRGADGN